MVEAQTSKPLPREYLSRRWTWPWQIGEIAANAINERLIQTRQVEHGLLELLINSLPADDPTREKLQEIQECGQRCNTQLRQLEKALRKKPWGWKTLDDRYYRNAGTLMFPLDLSPEKMASLTTASRQRPIFTSARRLLFWCRRVFG